MGVDVSHYQGVIDWSAVKAAGHSFAFAKMTDGAIGRDPLFLQNWRNMRAAGVLRGAYHYLRVQQNAETQAHNLFNAMQFAGFNDLDMPPVCDFEDRAGAANMSAEQVQNQLSAFLLTIQSLSGRVPIIYADPNFWSLYGSEHFGNYHLWAATYAAAPGTFAGWNQWAFWQYRDNGTVPGIAGPVDLDYWHASYPELVDWIKNSKVA